MVGLETISYEEGRVTRSAHFFFLQDQSRLRHNLKVIRFVILGVFLVSFIKTLNAETQLTFSATQKWDPKYEAYLTLKPYYLEKGWKNKISLDPPPVSGSAAVQKEIEELIVRQKKRNKADQKRIEQELEFFDAVMGGVPLTDKKRPLTTAFIKHLNRDMGVAVFYLKNKFNRVRPSFLSDEIQPSIKNPGHPAYPSGHATQAYCIARVLTLLDPSKEKAFYKSAKEIAQNREIAGVHYSSDSKAGELLAKQIMSMLEKNPKFLNAIKELKKKEWGVGSE